VTSLSVRSARIGQERSSIKRESGRSTFDMRGDLPAQPAGHPLDGMVRRLADKDTQHSQILLDAQPYASTTLANKSQPVSLAEKPSASRAATSERASASLLSVTFGLQLAKTASVSSLAADRDKPNRS
jgi:hypothetical protein